MARSFLEQSFLLVLGVFCGLSFSSRSQSVSNYATQVSAVVHTNPLRIVLSWPVDSGATGYSVHRKLRDDTLWGGGIVLAGSATTYGDLNVEVANAYEYAIRKTAASYYGEGYVYVGIHVPVIESRGKVILIVDNTVASSLANELKRLQQDLVGDGWNVLRHDVARTAMNPADTSSNVWAARSNELASVKALIQADYNADTNNVKAVLLLGHVPIPYSGMLAPDGHGNHLGAWPADMYYGDVSGIWTDVTWNSTSASDPRNWNVRGDGKPDRTALSHNVFLQVGRVDLANLPAFPQSETELLRQYLNKNHSFRHRQRTAERRGWIRDNFGLSGAGAPVAVNGWRNFSAFFGASNCFAGSDWFGTLSTNSFLWGYGCGGGTYTSCNGVGTTANFAASDPRVVFTMFFGSYFGDWDSQNNFLRAALATTNYTLTSAWVGRPYWQFHHMALGETIGFSTRLSQNSDGSLYSVNLDSRSVHIALMGDPTLRMHIVAPPAALVVTADASGGVELRWNPSPEPVLGYHVYRAPTSAGPFARVNSELIPATNYKEAGVNSNVCYMVRAVKLEVSASGSYYNSSQGIFADYAPLPGPLPKLGIISQADGLVRIQGEGIPARTYRIEFTPELTGTNWLPLGSATADTNQVFIFLDTNGPEQRFYRSGYP